MRSIQKRWNEYEDILTPKDSGGKFSRKGARKVKRELRRLAFY
jgi:hypothetical protein